MTDAEPCAAPGAQAKTNEGAHPHAHDSDVVREFGGTKGVAAIMVLSHALLYYMWIAWRYAGGAAPHPVGVADIGPWLGRMWAHVVEGASPSLWALGIYAAFLAQQSIFAVVMPGFDVKGLPIPSENGRRLDYRCNALACWYGTLVLAAALHCSGIFPLQRLYERFGELMTVAILASNAVAVAAFVAAHLRRRTHRMSGSFIYDFFMGAELNPRIGALDLKMWAEIRVSWILLFLLTAGAAAHQYATHGVLSAPLIFMLLAHGLYTNACMKGDECIPATWDFFYEKWGWMLIVGNLAGVPFLYCFNSMYLASRPPIAHSAAYTIFCFSLLLAAYYVWDTSLAQRVHFRMQERGTYIKRKAFPQLPWNTLENPRFIQTAHGNRLLVDGWWRYARKVPNVADAVMALSWGLVCGFDAFLPYLYFCFFVVMITHRASRDVARCRKKYGADWKRYEEAVPWVFIPGVWTVLVAFASLVGRSSS